MMRSLSGLSLTNRGRVALWVVALTCCAPAVSAGASAWADAAATPTQLVAYTVEPGDSLWSIALRLKRPGSDTRSAVNRIQRINRLPSSDIYAGQILMVEADQS